MKRVILTAAVVVLCPVAWAATMVLGLYSWIDVAARRAAR